MNYLFHFNLKVPSEPFIVDPKNQQTNTKHIIKIKIGAYFNKQKKIAPTNNIIDKTKKPTPIVIRWFTIFL